MIINQREEILVSGTVSQSNGVSSKYFVLSLEDTGEVISSKSYLIPSDSMDVQTIQGDSFDNIYLSGRILVDTAGHKYSSNTDHGYITKLDADLNVLWSKELVAEQFPCYDIDIATFPNGEIAFTYVTYGDLPVISGRISTDGELLWERGYEFYRPFISMSPDGSTTFLTSRLYNPDGTWQSGTLVARIGPDGSLPECPQFDACLWLEDMPLELEDLEWTREPGPILPDVEVEVSEMDVVAEPYCGTPAPPRPDFRLPDTICAGDCVRADSIRNALANAVEWYIETPQGQEITSDDDTLSFCFPLPGTYLVRQTVWLLGCAASYEQAVEVLSPLSVSLGEDRVWCPDDGLLCPVLNRDLAAYTWQDGSAAACYEVGASGAYGLVASDGYCTDSALVSLTLLSDTLLLPALDYGTKDTSLCRDFLPYEVSVSSPYSDAKISLDGSPLNSSTLRLDRAASYTLSTELLGCPLSDTLRLAVEDCLPSIYLPTAFSPNGDGRNDMYRPLGKDFEVVRLQVFDRWGGLLHEETGPGAAWDGRGAPVGQYVLLLRYRNSRTGREGEVSQGVALTR